MLTAVKLWRKISNKTTGQKLFGIFHWFTLETSILQKCRLYDYFRRYDKEFLIIITEKFQETFLKYLNVKSTQFFINIRLAQFLYHYIPPTINISDNKKQNAKRLTTVYPRFSLKFHLGAKIQIIVKTELKLVFKKGQILEHI